MSSYNTCTQEAGELTEKNHPRQKQQKKKKKRHKEKEKKTYPQATRQRKLEIALNLLSFLKM